MTNHDRRDLLKHAAAAGLGMFALPGSASAAFGSLGRLAGATAERRLLIIFLRGANDGCNMVIPHGDAGYFNQRPTVALPSTGADPSLVLSSSASGFARAHPRLGPLVSGASSPDVLQRIAWIHQAGHPDATRSHFAEMQIWEAGDVPNYALNEPLPIEGFVPRLVNAAGWTSALPACGLANYYRMFHATPPSPITGEYRNVDDPTVVGLNAPNSIDALIQAEINAQLSTATYPGIAGTVQGYGLASLASAGLLQNLPQFANNYFPGQAGDSAQVSLLLQQVRDAMRVLRHVNGCRVVGVNFGGFDTHADQLPRHDELMDALARALRGVHDMSIDGEGDPTFDDCMLTLVISEFGRTAADNGSGTDHGHGGAELVMGSNVNGAVYNCDPGSWTSLDVQVGLPSTDPSFNAVPVITDFRAIYSEILMKWFGLNIAQVAQVLPDQNPAGPPAWPQVGFLP